MARANDNWERLMGAVFRGNRLREMFHAQSRTPSMSSAASSEMGLRTSMDDPFLDLSLEKFESGRYVERQSFQFESGRYVEGQSMEALTRDDIKTIGIDGAQGIGKTMMAKRVGEMVKKGRLFDEVITSHDGPPVSGGGLSQNRKLSYGYASAPGKSSSMEDFYETRIDGVDGEIVGLFGVFDGHGGARAAEYVKENLFSNLIRHPIFISDTKSAIADAYCHTDTEFLKSENFHNRDAGSTACTAILVGDRLIVANVGDSRAVICRAGNAIAVSRDHMPHRTDERQRIEDAGGFVMWAGAWKVGGVLKVSRSFGHRLLKPYVIADPEIQEEKVDETLEFLILASKGLWDVVTNEEAVSMTKRIRDPEAAAQRVLQEAYRRGSADNITIVVVWFLANQDEPSNSNSI